MTGRIDLPQGTLDLLILKTLSLGALHGWAVAERVRQVSRAALAIPQGSLYPALHRLERRGWIEAAWAKSARGKRAKYYSLTATGRKQLVANSRAWDRLSAAIQLVLNMT
jgi:PadR family transcriptional regulator PadR